MLPLNLEGPMRTEPPLQVGGAEEGGAAVGERRAEQYDVGHVRERHVFVGAVDANALARARQHYGRVRAGGPLAAGIGEDQRATVDGSAAAASAARLPVLHQGSGTHRNAHSG